MWFEVSLYNPTLLQLYPVLRSALRNTQLAICLRLGLFPALSQPLPESSCGFENSEEPEVTEDLNVE